MSEHSKLPICCVTGRIAGDRDGCGDCDPCGAAYSVPEPVRALLRERDDWAERYSNAMGERDEARNLLPEMVMAAEAAAQAIKYSIEMGGTDPGGVLLQALNKIDAALSKARAGASPTANSR